MLFWDAPLGVQLPQHTTLTIKLYWDTPLSVQLPQYTTLTDGKHVTTVWYYNAVILQRCVIAVLLEYLSWYRVVVVGACL